MRIGEARRKGKCFDIGANTIPFTRENTRLIGMTLRQFPTITGEGGRVSSRNRDLGTDGGTMDREIEAVVRPHQTLLASKEILYMSKQWTLVARILFVYRYCRA